MKMASRSHLDGSPLFGQGDGGFLYRAKSVGVASHLCRAQKSRILVGSEVRSGGETEWESRRWATQRPKRFARIMQWANEDSVLHWLLPP
jgi:hypothetical protein